MEHNVIEVLVCGQYFLHCPDLFELYSILCCREPGAEQKFKEISNAYEVVHFHGYAVFWFSIRQLRIFITMIYNNLSCRFCQMMRNDLYMIGMVRLDLKVLVWAWG